MGTQLVWLKRDLRIEDHAPLAEAAAAGPCVVLYVYEPEVVAHSHADPAHLAFVNQSLAELERRLEERGGRLTRLHGELPGVFDRLHHEHPFEAIWSHEETGNDTTYQRDRRVRRWCRQRGVAWHERRQTGVVRRLPSRDGWARRWHRLMNQPIVEPPERITPADGVRRLGEQTAADLGLPATTMTRA
ncbi:MAG: deoxyribodipyrimidine photo-lyase, partial [Planctomycetota bacterium]